MGRRRVVAVVIWTAFSSIKTRPHTSLYSPSRVDRVSSKSSRRQRKGQIRSLVSLTDDFVRRGYLKIFY